MSDVLDSLRRAHAEMENLLTETESQKTQLTAQDRQIALLESENENLRRQIKREKEQRDHYFRAFTALSARVETLIHGAIEAIKSAKTHSYETPQTGAPRQLSTRRDSGEPIPEFLRKGPAVDLHKFETALGGMKQ